MSDADLIYNALLRAERRFEALAAQERHDAQRAYHMFARGIVQTVREEIGNGLSKDSR